MELTRRRRGRRSTTSRLAYQSPSAVSEWAADVVGGNADWSFRVGRSVTIPVEFGVESCLANLTWVEGAICQSATACAPNRALRSPSTRRHYCRPVVLTQLLLAERLAGMRRRRIRKLARASIARKSGVGWKAPLPGWVSEVEGANCQRAGGRARSRLRASRELPASSLPSRPDASSSAPRIFPGRPWPGQGIGAGAICQAIRGLGGRRHSRGGRQPGLPTVNLC